MIEQFASYKNEDVTICVNHIEKYFRIYKDKSHTFKDRILNHKRNHYELNKVLNDISFNVHRGEALGLIGHNGCGKSTTLKLLNRILYPDKGTIEMKGRISSLIELGAGFHPDMTGRENIYINASIFGLKKKEIDARLEKIIRFSELEEFIDNPVRTYSSGMYMRLAFSIAINVDADILLIDEILAVGDANFQKKCFDKLRKIKEQGTTIVIVSHSMEQIKNICDQVIWLENGKIRGEGDPRVVCTEYLDAMDAAAEERHELEMLEENGSISLNPNIIYPPLTLSSQCCKSARRSGTMEVRFTELVIKNLKRLPDQKFCSTDSLLLEGTLLANMQVLHANIVVKIFNRYGGHCLTLESSWDLKKDIILKGYSHISLLLKQLHLVPGIYYLDVLIYGSDGKIFDSILHYIEFTVEPLSGTSRDNLGVVEVDHVWKIDGDVKDNNLKEERA